MPTPTPSSEPPWRAGLRSARANLGPGVVLQVAALALVLAYYRHAPTHHAIDRLAEFRAQRGWVFGVVSTAFFGAVIPFAYLALRRAKADRYSWSEGLCLLIFWAYKGFEIDLFYRLLARLVGEGHELGTIAAKMALDQFVYSPLLAVPTTVLVYAWCESHFDTSRLINDVRAPHWYRRRVLPIMVSNVGVWLPAVAIIYSLPTPLQLPLQNLVLCFYTLLISHQTKHANDNAIKG
jgi:hypothetical protein